MIRPGEPLRVLVIDDDPDAVLLITQVLVHRGAMIVTTAGSADEAQQQLFGDSSGPESAYDVAVTDVEMPGTTGLQLLGRLRSRYPGLPVVMVTAHASVDYAVSALRGQPDTITIVTLSRGARGGMSVVREDESRAAAQLLEAHLLLGDLEDTWIPVSDPTVSTIQRAIAEAPADIVYVHSLNDLHQDHRAVHQAAMVTACGVPTVTSYQSPSATVDFRPNRFVAIARYWSRYDGGRYTEPLEVMRDGVRLDTRPPNDATHAGRQP